MEDLAKKLVKYLKSLGIEVYTNTKARGHQGFYVKNRIDISKNTKEERVIPTLLHEFAHFIHDKLEKDMAKTGGSLEVLFCIEGKGKGESEKDSQKYVILNLFQDLIRERPCDPDTSSGLREGCFFDVAVKTQLEKELTLVTNFVDDNSLFQKLTLHKNQVKQKIKKLEEIIKLDYPNFMRSKKFKEFDKYIKKSKAKYLMKYDRVKFVSRHMFKLLRQVEILSIDYLEKDFPDMPPAFCAYIRLKSQQRKQARNSRRLNYYKKYYSKPTELFSRLVEGLYIDCEHTKTLAPLACERFFELLEDGYYFELKEVFQLILSADNMLVVS